jgi:hypothetical protein
MTKNALAKKLDTVTAGVPDVNDDRNLPQDETGEKQMTKKKESNSEQLLMAFQPVSQGAFGLDESYFGVCPECHRSDGYINCGKSHWGYCKAHKTCWFFGENLLSTWVDETQEEQVRIFNELDFGSFKDVEPFRGDVASDDGVAFPNQAPEDEIPMVPAKPASPVRTGEDAPATPTEYSIFIGRRATKIIRDKLPKAGLKDPAASNAVTEYLLKQSGKTSLKHISASTFERLLGALEAATPEQAAEIVNRPSAV